MLKKSTISCQVLEEACGMLSPKYMYQVHAYARDQMLVAMRMHPSYGHGRHTRRRDDCCDVEPAEVAAAQTPTSRDAPPAAAAAASVHSELGLHLPTGPRMIIRGRTGGALTRHEEHGRRRFYDGGCCWRQPGKLRPSGQPRVYQASPHPTCRQAHHRCAVARQPQPLATPMRCRPAHCWSEVTVARSRLRLVQPSIQRWEHAVRVGGSRTGSAGGGGVGWPMGQACLALLLLESWYGSTQGKMNMTIAAGSARLPYFCAYHACHLPFFAVLPRCCRACFFMG